MVAGYGCRYLNKAHICSVINTPLPALLQCKDVYLCPAKSFYQLNPSLNMKQKIKVSIVYLKVFDMAYDAWMIQQTEDLSFLYTFLNICLRHANQ